MEPGYQKVKSLMVACREGSASGYINRVNLGEVHYKTIRVLGLEGAKDFMENFARLPITIVLPDEPLIWKASELKAQYPISYADCFAAATALIHDASVVTGDPEFKKLTKILSVDWL
jgi:ribonuclease VapC